MKEKAKNVLFWGVLFLVFDQIIKIFLSANLKLNQSILIIKDFFTITLTHNTGAAFSILSGSGFLLIIIGILAVLGLVLYVNGLDDIEDSDTLIYSLLMGGILGNLIDRIIHGYVIDYLSFKFYSYYFPVFNFADICIVVSIILIIARMLRADLWN